MGKTSHRKCRMVFQIAAIYLAYQPIAAHGIDGLGSERVKNIRENITAKHTSEARALWTEALNKSGTVFVCMAASTASENLLQLFWGVQYKISQVTPLASTQDNPQVCLTIEKK